MFKQRNEQYALVMKTRLRHRGIALLLTVYIVALLSAVVIGLLQLSTIEIQIMGNHVYAAEALAIAEAGLNDAFAQIRTDASWTSGFQDKAFAGGSYTVLMTTTATSTEPIPPDVTDGELQVEALGAIYPGATQDFAVSHPLLTGADFDNRAEITINAGSYYYKGPMNGSPFTVSIPLDAESVSFQIVLKKLLFVVLPVNINCQVSWILDTEGSTSTHPTIISEGTSPQGYVARVTADITIGSSVPHTISINRLRINE
jgi:hypothetical protein